MKIKAIGFVAIQDPDGNKLIIHKLKPENQKEPCP